jgi:hypothetical protein
VVFAAQRFLALLAYFEASNMPASISAIFLVKTPQNCNPRLQKQHFNSQEHSN